MFEIAKLVFYAFAFLPIMYEAFVMLYPVRVHKFIERTESKESKEKGFDEKQKQFSFLMTCYFIWSFIGLFSFQWIVFFGLFMIGFIPKWSAWQRWVDGFISFVFLIFIVINAYHFKIDLYQLLK